MLDSGHGMMSEALVGKIAARHGGTSGDSAMTTRTDHNLEGDSTWKIPG
jgi:hypothetical protein